MRSTTTLIVSVAFGLSSLFGLPSSANAETQPPQQQTETPSLYRGSGR